MYYVYYDYVLLTSDLWLVGINKNGYFIILESIVEVILLPR